MVYKRATVRESFSRITVCVYAYSHTSRIHTCIHINISYVFIIRVVCWPFQERLDGPHCLARNDGCSLLYDQPTCARTENPLSRSMNHIQIPTSSVKMIDESSSDCFSCLLRTVHLIIAQIPTANWPQTSEKTDITRVDNWLIVKYFRRILAVCSNS